MKINYTITNQTLNSIYEFSRVHALLYSVDQKSDWIKSIRTSLGKRAARAAITIDSEYPPVELLDEDFKLPKDLKASRNHYMSLKQSLVDRFQKANEISLETILSLHAEILGDEYKPGQSRIRKHNKILPKVVNQDGVFKKVMLPIRTKPAQIERKLNGFINWLNSEFKIINPIILAAITHLRIVEVHAFDDGNGRLAKLLEHGILIQHGIDPSNLLPIEEYYLRFREHYYDIVEEAIISGDVTEWLEFFSQALLFSANQAVEELYHMSGGTVDVANNSIIDVTEKEQQVIHLLAKMQDPNGSEIARQMGVSRQSINVILNRLAEKDIVKKTGQGSGVRYELNI